MVSTTEDSRYYWKIIVLAVSIIIISLSHYVTGTEHKYHGLHEIYRRLYYIPIILSAFWFGIKGGIFCAIVVSFFLSASRYFSVGCNFLTDDIPRTLEIVLYYIIGFVTGFLSQKQMDATKSLKKTIEERDESYDKLKQQAEVLVQTEEQLRRADRLSALGKLSAGIAHEVRNPLASIKGTAEILSDKFKLGDKEYEFVEILIKEVNRLDTVVADFLDFAKPKPPELKSSKINDIILSVLKLTEHQITRAKIDLKTKLEDSLPSVYVDPEQIKQVFLNLIINTVEAMPEGGVLEAGSHRIIQKSYALSPTQAQESVKSRRRICLLHSLPVKPKVRAWGLQSFTGYLKVIRARSDFLQKKMLELHLQYVYRLRQINTDGEAI